MTPGHAIGIDLGGTNIKAALVDASGAITYKAATICQPERGAETVISEMAQICQDLLGKGSLSAEDVVGIGLGTPGPLDLTKGEIVRAANLPGWTAVPIRDRLQELTGMPVVLENDANAAAFGEFWAGAGGGCGDMVMLTLGTGVGSGVIVDGRLLHGHFQNAGELGHMIIVPEGLSCPCGQRGCLEQYSSAGAVARRAIAALQAGETGKLRAILGQAGTVSSRDVVEAALEGDPLCRRLWRETCLYLAIACVNIQHAFNPATVVLGGGLAEAAEFLLIPVREEFRQNRWRLMVDVPEIVLASLAYDAGVIGAAGLAWAAWRQRPPQ
jgi:glucokinase